MQRIQLVAPVVAMICVTVVRSATSAEHRVELSELPVPVQHTIAKESAGGTVRAVSEETKNGELYYEAELNLRGHAKDMLFDRNGAIVEVEEEIALESVSDAARLKLIAEAGHGKIVRVESILRAGRLVGYEAEVETGAKKAEIQVSPEGQLIGSAPQRVLTTVVATAVSGRYK